MKKMFLLLILLSSGVYSQNLFINEFMAINNSTIKDNFGRFEDWIEIYNAGNFPVDLTGFGLTDDKTYPYKWVFTGDIEIPAKGYLLIWASNKDTIIGDFIHTNFALSGAGEFIGLSSPTQIFIDSITFGSQTADRSYGRKPDGSQNWMIFISPTPGFSNDSLSTLPMSTPTFSHSSGIYSTPFSLTLSHPITNAQIFYTLDGSHPTTNSILYTSPILIDSNRVVRAIAHLAGRPDSKIETRSYFISPGGNLPILSLVTDPQNLYNPDTGIYINYDSTGDNWERYSTIEFFERNGIDKFTIDCGLKIHGGYSRPKPKKSFRVNFRKVYDNSILNYDFFRSNINKFNSLVIRSGSNDMLQLSPRWTLMREQLISKLYSRYKGLISDGIYVQMYLNGKPFGIYHLREHIDSMYLNQRLNIKYPELRETWYQKLGSSANWDSIWSFVYNNHYIDSIEFKFLEERIDIDNYIDYFAFEVYAGNVDWPHNNQIYARNASGGKWKWILWDVDQGFGCYSFIHPNTIAFALRDTVRTDLLYYDYPDLVEGTRFPRRLFSNEKFRERFISRFTDLLNSAFQPSNVLPILDSLKNVLNTNINFEISKWGSNYNRWLANVDTLRQYVVTRVDSLRIYTAQQFGFAGLNSITVNNLDPTKGTVRINDLKISSQTFTGKYFTGMKINVNALPGIGYKFERWSDSTLPQSKSFTATVDRDFNLEPIFVPDTSPINIVANDVIINEYWLNDNGTRYSSINYRPIYGDWVELLVTREGGLDLRNWRLTNNSNKTKLDSSDLNEGSIFFKNIPQLSSVPKGTYILLILKKHPSNDYYFSSDDLDYSDSSMIFYIGNGNLDGSFDPGFGVRTSNDRLVLLHPNKSLSYSDDIGVDFISEGSDVTPASFGVANDGVNFINPFVGIGDDDGAIFAFSPLNNFNNDNGSDEIPGDDKPGSGGWIVDPSKEFTGDDPGNPNQQNILTPGKKNYSGTLDVVDLTIPEKFILYQNFPNPFNSQTKIKFAIPKSVRASIKVYDILGRQITELINDEKMPGFYELNFDASKYNLASGVYFVRFESKEFYQTIKLVYIK